MSKLAPSLKALINAPFARPGQAPAPRHIRDVYARIAREARERQYGERPWVTLSVSPLSLVFHISLLTYSTGRSNIHAQLPRLPAHPPPPRLLLSVNPHPARHR